MYNSLKQGPDLYHEFEEDVTADFYECSETAVNLTKDFLLVLYIQADESECHDSENFSLPSSWASQASSWQASSTTESQDLLEDSVEDGLYFPNNIIQLHSNKSFADEKDLTGSVVLVMWCCLLQLFSKCMRDGCAARVLPDNITTSRNGRPFK